MRGVRILLFSGHVHGHGHHDFLFLRLALGDEDRQGSQAVVSDRHAPIRPHEHAVLMEEGEVKQGGDALVPVGEYVVLHEEIEEVRCLFLDAWVDLLAKDILGDLAEDALKGAFVFLSAEEVAALVERGLSDEFEAFRSSK